MLDCLNCKVKEEQCEFKRDVVTAIKKLDEYLSVNTIEEITNIMQQALDPCDDYDPED